MFYEFELVIRKNFYKNFRVSNSKCDVILRKSITYLENSEPSLILQLELETYIARFGLIRGFY